MTEVKNLAPGIFTLKSDKFLGTNKYQGSIRIQYAYSCTVYWKNNMRDLKATIKSDGSVSAYEFHSRGKNYLLEVSLREIVLFEIL